MPSAPVVLVHGFATSAARTWGDNGWIDLLADAGRSVLAPDLLGHGTSPRPHEPAAYDELENLLEASLPDEPVDAIGFSLGARSLLVLASRSPERFGRLVVAGVGANLFRHDDPELMASAVEADSTPEHPGAAYFHQLARTPGNDPEALAALLRRPGAPPLTEAIVATIPNPVLVVLGDRDFAGPADPLVDALTDVRLVTLSGTDHFATPKSFAFIDAALEFLGALP